MSVPALLGALGLLAANGFFVAAEFALVAARRSRLEELAAQGRRGARSAIAGVRELSLMLAGAQLGITLASLGLGAIAEPAVASALSELLGLAGVPTAVRGALAFAIALTIVVFLHMVVGEMAPKTWAIGAPERAALVLAVPFRAFTLVLRPFITLLNVAANGVVRALGVQPVAERVIVHDPRALRQLVAESAARGTLSADERDLLDRTLAVGELDAEAAMIPRPDIVAVRADADVAELERLACATGRSRLPVHRGDLDDLVGVLHVKDLLALPEARREQVRAEDLARPALVVPEPREAEGLLRELRDAGQHVALVVDEYGTVSGLVALEDLLEELIGEFEDESDQADATALVAAGAVRVPGSLRPDELAARTGVHLPPGEHETVAGFLIARLGHLPVQGESVDVDQARLEAARVEGPRVVEVAVHR